jgi:hypothetical protein
VSSATLDDDDPGRSLKSHRRDQIQSLSHVVGDLIKRSSTCRTSRRLNIDSQSDGEIIGVLSSA